MRRVILILLIVFLALSASSQMTAIALGGQTILYVATDGSDDGNDCTAQNNPCATIAHAIAQSTNTGYTIMLASGTYTEANILVYKNNLTISGASPNDTIVQAANVPPPQAPNAGRVFRIFFGFDVTIENMTIRHGFTLERGAGRGASHKIYLPDSYSPYIITGLLFFWTLATKDR